MPPKVLIGLTGSFGSGCTKIAKDFLVPREYFYIKLTDFLRESYYQETGKDRSEDIKRTVLQDYGNYLREQHGPGHLARLAIAEINRHPEIDKWVIDSIRNPEEAEAFRQEYRNFFLMGIFADKEIRWQRSRQEYKDNYSEFNADEERDSGESFIHGQKVTECFLNADLVIANNIDFVPGNEDHLFMNQKIEKYVSRIENPFSYSPDEEEAIMSMAYANSQRSSCEKRKVGAVIVDDYGNLFSSGYNEVPIADRTCKQKWGGVTEIKLRRTSEII